ncbi:MAG: 3-deoxy-8-phosphooctulonate synthase [Chthoniobacterales bacterium]|nr:3-deoxy-8-phosphooctulonate synthase [Chthoniobacterales bacterium]
MMIHNSPFWQSGQLFFFCGPCVIESRSFALETAEQLNEIFTKASVPWVYKSSFDKANRSSATGYRGVGMEEGLSILNEIKDKLKILVMTDVHESWQCAPVAEIVDVLQTPAFLCRQTDFIRAAATTGRPVNIKKGQFLSPWEMANVIEKARSASRAAGKGDGVFFACERGTTFGYGNLVVDMRGLAIMAEKCRCPVVFDATHSVQLPGAQGTSSGGQREYAGTLARAAVATGAVDGVFLEAHPNPDHAPCDGPNMIPFADLPKLIDQLREIQKIVKKNPKN